MENQAPGYYLIIVTIRGGHVLTECAIYAHS